MRSGDGWVLTRILRRLCVRADGSWVILAAEDGQFSGSENEIVAILRLHWNYLADVAIFLPRKERSVLSKLPRGK